MAMDETNYQWWEKSHGADPTTQWQLEDARKKGIFGGLPQWLQDMIGANATKYGLDFGHLVGTGGAWPILGPNGYYQPGGDPGPTPPAKTDPTTDPTKTASTLPTGNTVDPVTGRGGTADMIAAQYPSLGAVHTDAFRTAATSGGGPSTSFAGLAALAGALGGAQSKKRKPGIGQYL